MKLVFCISNLFVPATLTLIKQAGGRAVLIYTDQKGMSDFFKSLKLKNVIVYYRPDLHLRNNFKSIYRFFKERKTILKQLRLFNCSELYFFHITFGNIENWLIKKLSASTTVYYVPIFNILPINKRYSFKALKGVLISLLTSKIMVIPLWTGEKNIYKIANSFFKLVNANSVQLEIDNKFIKGLVDEKNNWANKEIVLLTGTNVELNQVNEDEYISKINALIQVIGKNKIIAKPHPRFPNLYGLENNLEVITSNIPANVLFTKFKVFMGYSSAVLCEAANNGLVAISLLDFLKPVNEEKKENYKSYLMKNLKTNQKIYFPKDISSIKEII